MPTTIWNRWWNQSIGFAIPPSSRSDWLRWIFSAFGLWLIAATRPLWWNWDTFPQVPWFAWGCFVPRQVDACLLALVGVSLVGIAATGAQSRLNRISLLSFAGAIFGLMLLDQHRCQPWAYQWLLMAVILAATPHDLAIKLLRVLVLGIYIHSAISKCDYAFCAGLGHSFIRVLESALLWPGSGISFDGIWWPLVFPLGELLVAIGLLWPRMRRMSLYLATTMHLVVLYILGPFGLHHSWGVLIWNLYFIVQNWILFGGRRQESTTSAPAIVTRYNTPIGSRFAIGLTLWISVWPLLQPWGYCDLWPAWGLYAQYDEQLVINVMRSSVNKLPAAWRQVLMQPGNRFGAGAWCWLPYQQISLDQTWAPVYPATRFEIGIALALARDGQLPADHISVTRIIPLSRWRRDIVTVDLENLHAIQSQADSYWWNAQPRHP